VPKIGDRTACSCLVGTRARPQVAVAALVAIFPISSCTVQGLRLGRAGDARPRPVLRASPPRSGGDPGALALPTCSPPVGRHFARFLRRHPSVIHLSRAGWVTWFVTSQCRTSKLAQMFRASSSALLSLLLFNRIELSEHLLLPWPCPRAGATAARPPLTRRKCNRRTNESAHCAIARWHESQA